MAKKFALPKWNNYILNANTISEVCDHSLEKSLNCMMLGETEQANRIIDYLYDNELLSFITGRPALRERFHTAWTASDCWPKIYSSPEDWTAPAKEGVEVDGPTLFPKPDHKETIVSWYELLQKPYGTPFVFDDFVKARQMVANGSNKDAIPLSVEIALELDLGDVAGEVVRGELIKLLRERSCSASHGILSGPGMWKFLSTGWLRRDLGLTRAQIEQDVEIFLRLVDERLDKVRAAALRQKSIKELCELFDQACRRKKRLGNTGASRRFDDEDSELPQSFLKPPASEAAIKELDRKAKAQGFPDGLPEDYKTFLRITNGIYDGDDKDDGSDIFFPAECVKFRPFYLPDELLPNGALPTSISSLEESYNWPESEENCIDLGHGGDEGDQMFLPPSRIKAALEHFDKIHRQLGPTDQANLERGVKDFYGGMEQFRGMTSIVLRCFHWMAEVEAFDSFKTLLAMTVASMYTDDDNDEIEDEEDGEGQRGLPDDNEKQVNDADDDGNGDGNDTEANVRGSPAEAAKKRHSTGQGDSSKRQKSATDE